MRPAFGEAFRFWLQLGLISFGGPAGQIAIMQTELVEKRRWISQPRFLHALNFCMLLPGPEATQLAIYVGWLLHGTIGGITAGALFVLPSIIVLWCLSLIYVLFGQVNWIAAVFYGLKPAVIAIVIAAVIRIGRRALRNELMWFLAALSFVALFFFHLPFPLVIVSAGALGLIGARFWPSKFHAVNLHHSANDNPDLSTYSSKDNLPAWHRSLRVILVSLLLWLAPTIVAGVLLGKDATLFQEAIFFSKAAVVTFGGAYAVLPYVAQQAVGHYGWLQAGQMMDGLGLAETTPGPLIMVVQFVGFIGGWNHPGTLTPLVAATAGALITTWVTFVPCFLWIFLGAPYIERLRDHQSLTAAFSTITAAVVGVVLNLAVWFSLHVLVPFGSVDWFAVGISAVALSGMLRWRWGVVSVLVAAGIAGVLYQLSLTLVR